ncbi:Scr1 family TA system antitoxin-like transcriptional regulator [Micromonospora sp. NPDC003241]
MQVGAVKLPVELAELGVGFRHQQSEIHQAVLDAQLGRLSEEAQLPHVRLHVVPNSVGAHVGLDGGFVLVELPDREQAIYLENAARGHVINGPETVRLMDRKWDSLLGEALSTRTSLDLIRKLKVTP